MIPKKKLAHQLKLNKAVASSEESLVSGDPLVTLLLEMESGEKFKMPKLRSPTMSSDLNNEHSSMSSDEHLSNSAGSWNVVEVE